VFFAQLLVQIHAIRADEFLTEMALARVRLQDPRFHHALEASRWPINCRNGVAIATWPDWWGF